MKSKKKNSILKKIVVFVVILTLVLPTLVTIISVFLVN